MATTRELIAAQIKGAEILHNGAPVSHSPRHRNDQAPWVHTARVPDPTSSKGWRLDVARYKASQCDIYWPQEVERE